MKTTSSATALIVSLALGATALVNAEDSKIDIKGSDTLGAKLVPQLKNAYIKDNPSVKIDILAQGSSHAFSNLDAGSADIGMSSRGVKQKELDMFEAKGNALVEHVAAWDMIAVIVNEKNPVRKLSLKQIEGIFTGTITNWSEVGGPDATISVYTRNTSSGTYKSFSELAMSKKDYGTKCQKLEGNQPIVTEVAKNTNGIGYVGFAYAKGDHFKTIKVEGVSAKVSKIADYPLARKLYYYTVGEPTGEAAKFLKWATSSDTANDIVSEIGFIPTPIAEKAMGVQTK
jgi:phosphate transport system substrate-binding protein